MLASGPPQSSSSSSSTNVLGDTSGSSYGKAPDVPGPRPGPYGQEDVQLNEDGLPIRPGKAQCLVYTSTGSCNNGPMCIFDHPPKASLKKLDSTMPPGPPPLPGVGGGASVPPMGMPPPPKGVLPKAPPVTLEGGVPPLPPQVPGPGPAVMGDGSLPALPDSSKPSDAPPADGKKEDQPAPAEGSSSSEAAPPAKVEYNDDGLPMRPGMQKCGFYLRSGVCNYGPGCRYDHPPGLGGLLAGGGGMGSFPGMIGGPMTEGGLARRPGKDQCPFLAKTGSCPFGPECRFDHQTGEAATTCKPVIQPPVSHKKAKGLGGVKSRRPVRTTWR